MRRNILTFLFILLSIAAYAGSSNSEKVPADKVPIDSLNAQLYGIAGDSVNIKDMVTAQIEAARNKQVQDSITAADSNSVQKLPAKTAVESQAVVTLKHNSEKTELEKLSEYLDPVFQAVRMSNELTIKMAIMGVATFFAFFIILIRRTRLGKKKTTKRDTKDGIKLIREEKVKDKKDGKLSLVRNKLLGSAPSFQLSKESVSKNARELNIAKGEIYLAARIKSHELKKASY
jgi:hypothetical protein